jgi:hypothetical protein
MSNSPRIVYCHCAYAQVIPNDVKRGVLQRLSESGADFDCVPDLCEMSARRDPMLQQLAQHPQARIAACHPRAVKGLFTAAGSPLPSTGVQIVNMRVLKAEEAYEALVRSETTEPATLETPRT